MMIIKGQFNQAVVYADTIDEGAVKQIREMCNQAIFQDAKIRIMPDVHVGKGCVIGFTADLKNKYVPNLVGVDLSCGMETTILGKVTIDFEALDHFIKHHIPSGFAINNQAREMPEDLEASIRRIAKVTSTDPERHIKSFGSLGGGNHFIEVNEGLDGTKYLVVHSGSRNFGLQIATHYQKIAVNKKKKRIVQLKKEMTKVLADLKRKKQGDQIEATKQAYKDRIKAVSVPDSLAYLEGQDAENYLEDAGVAHDFAVLNRQEISRRIIQHLGLDDEVLDHFTTVHNYIDPEDGIIRKGAISAKKGERVLIPINMAVGSILAIGKGNPDWNFSGPHGAGRLLSRHQAKEKISMEDYRAAMAGIYTSSVKPSTLDEAPMAYKSMDEIVKHMGDTLEIIEVIRPLYNFKA